MRTTWRQNSRARVGALAAWVLVIMMMAVIPAGPAQAAVVCGPSMNVATFTDLDDAVVCFNAETTPGVYTINVNADITYTAPLTSIVNTTGGVSLNIAGNGNTLNANNDGSVLTNLNSSISVDSLTITGGNTNGGGGIHNTGTLTVSNTTITGNTASTTGGGIYNFGTTKVSNSTISDNTAAVSGGGIQNNDGTVNVWFSTVTDNTAPDGAGLWSFHDTATITNVGGSIVADNLGGGGDVDYRFGTGTNSFISHGFNVIGDGNAIGDFASAGDITGVTTASLVLGPLANNGGPTQTHALLPGSLAIDRMTGSPTWNESFDQRGIARPLGVAKDSGAYEAFVCGSSMNVSTFDHLDAAVVCFNAQTTAGVYTININADITYTASLSAIVNTTGGVSLNIAGNGNTLNANNSGNVLAISDSTVSVDSLTITGGNTNSGGGILSSGTLTVSNSTITGNTANIGGGIYNESGGQVTVSNSTVTDNTATTSGGGIHNNFGTLSVWFSTVTANTAPDGAGLWSYNDTFAFTNIGGSIVANNLGAGGDVDYKDGTGTNSFISDDFNVIGDGNAIGNFASAGDITGVTAASLVLGPLANNGGPTQTHALLLGSVAIDRMTGNPTWDQPADQRGIARSIGVAKDSGAYEADPCDTTIWNVATFTDLDDAVVCFNAETTPGVYTVNINADIAYNAPLTSIVNTTGGVSLDIAGNGNTLNAAANGNVLINFGSTVSIDSLTITGGDTGGIISSGALTVSNTTITDNTATTGGGIYNSGEMTVSNTTITDNTATTGGGIYNAAGTATVTNTTISDNTATVAGGGIYNNDDSVNVWFTTITANTAPDGAGLWSYNDTLTFTNVGGSIVANNLGAGGDVDYKDGTGTNSFSSDGFNVIGDGNATSNFTSAGDITAVTTASLALGPLANNGGPTRTHALLPGSVAIDRMTGNPTWNESTDQRGIVRPLGVAKDSGAYEADPCDTTIWNVATFASLDDAVVCFNAQTTPGVYTININADITYTAELTTISNTTFGVSLNIAGNGNTLDANNNGTVLNSSARMVSVDSLTITGGNGAFGGGINNGDGGTVTVSNSTITDNKAFDGGGINNGDGALTVSNTTITDNTATTAGGILNIFGTVTVTNTTISDNTATNAGGGIYNEVGTVNVWFSTITANTAPDGAGIWSYNELFAFTNIGGSIVANNLGAGGDVDYKDGTGTNSFISHGFNVIGDGNATSNFTSAGDITGVTTASLVLGPLANNGGPTQTHALLPGSVAIDRMTGSPTWNESFDQRGIARPVGVAKDSGAFEGVSAAHQVSVLAAPCVIYDSPTASGPLAGAFNGGELRTISATGPLTGQGGAATCVPAGASAVVVTISAIEPQASGNLRLSESGVTPNGGVVNYTNNSLNNANTVTVPLSTSGELDVFANGGAAGVGLPSTDVHVAVVAYYSPTGTLTYNPVTPCAVADSRTNQNPAGGFVGPFTSGAAYPDVDVAGTFSSSQGGNQTNCGIPTDASAVLVNVVAVNTTGGTGYLATGTGATTPTEPTTPFATLGMNNATTSIIPIGTPGTIAVDIHALTGAPSTHVRIVVLGYYHPSTGSNYTPLNACTAFDTRTNQNPTGVFLGERNGGQTTTYQISGVIPSAQGGNGGNCGVPSNATSVQINIVAVNATQPGNLQAFATGTTPTGGILNFAPLTPAMNNANTVTIPISALGQLDIHTNTGPTNHPNATHIRGIILGYSS